MPTIKDIAKIAGTSVTSVSRVLNNRGYLSEELKSKVFQAMEELNYQPNEVARSLQKKQSQIIGLIVPDVAHPFFGELTAAIETYAFSQGYKLLVCNSKLDSAKEIEYLHMLRASQVDGIIMGSHTMDVKEYLLVKQPLVTIDRKISDDIPYICSDNYLGGGLAANELVEKGCLRLAYIGGNTELDLLAKKRYDGFRDVLAKKDVWHTCMQTNTNGFDLNEYKQLAENLFSTYSEIDGVFASSDLIAAFILKECHRLNKLVPNHVKIIGYDDVNMSSIVTPELTTVRQPISLLAQKSVELIIDQVKEKEISKETIFPVSLVKRQTT
ncbi:LacI family transcriptional regulator [Salipaludibacillus keqinensis]|uniref:LacI family transcriptional regulator n=1 Tax=Salipaludibacillus keqinensis TaxID=2045207 RepID=A0A323TNU4_9BACI|nr:LacI family DNA-binding transcriptional regulator [Salipaludibacillus keqinensis]PYZ94393.1 LacI family transcriptional regulator [Salipaludibacillus keqinensis]